MLQSRLWQRIARRCYAQQVPLPPSHNPKMTSPGSPAYVEGLPVFPRTNVLGTALRPAPIGDGPTTGFFRNNFCDASPHDPGSHTLAAVVTPSFLDFSKSRGNDLWPLFPALKKQASSANSAQDPAPSACVWCLCASRWYEAVKAAASHPLGDQIVPRVVLEATHERALQDGRFTKDEVVKYAADITDGDASPAPGQGGQLQ